MNLCYLECGFFKRLLCIFGCSKSHAICNRIDRYLVRKEGR